jgi:hypothetical protein
MLLRCRLGSDSMLRVLHLNPRSQPRGTTDSEFNQFDRYNSSSTIAGGMFQLPRGYPDIFPPN